MCGTQCLQVEARSKAGAMIASGWWLAGFACTIILIPFLLRCFSVSINDNTSDVIAYSSVEGSWRVDRSCSGRYMGQRLGSSVFYAAYELVATL